MNPQSLRARQLYTGSDRAANQKPARPPARSNLLSIAMRQAQELVGHHTGCGGWGGLEEVAPSKPPPSKSLVWWVGWLGGGCPLQTSPVKITVPNAGY